MKKEITAPHPVDEVTGLNQRKKLTAVSMNVDTDYFGLSYEVEKLDPKGNPIAFRASENKSVTIGFDTHPKATPTGTYQTEIPQDIKDAIAAIKAIAEPLFLKYGVERVEVPAEEKGAEDEV